MGGIEKDVERTLSVVEQMLSGVEKDVKKMAKDVARCQGWDKGRDVNALGEACAYLKSDPGSPSGSFEDA